jgi:hypothetical protein
MSTLWRQSKITLITAKLASNTQLSGLANDPIQQEIPCKFRGTSPTSIISGN